MRPRMKISLLFSGLALTCALSGVLADEGATPHTLKMPGDLSWGPAPSILPPGAKLAALAGDPAQPGLFIVRLKLPANYRIPAHWHPTDEHITVVSGAFYAGMGDKLDPAKTTALPPGGFVTMPAKMHHFAMTKKETVIELISMGPFEMTYVNPADTPSGAALAK